MSNFYISEILYLTQFSETMGENAKTLATIQELVIQHLQNKKPKLAVQNSQILWYNRELASFKIDLVREIIRETQYANWDQQTVRVIVLLNFTSASLAAQNALLKLIEEPPANTLIILPIIHDQNLLNTISSRCIQYQIASQKGINKENLEEVYRWPSDATEIFALINEFKDRERAIKLVHNLLKQKLSYQQKQALSQAYLDLKANANVRLSLEHCFLSVL